jgi:Tfp pilus assembly protein PilX
MNQLDLPDQVAVLVVVLVVTVVLAILGYPARGTACVLLAAAVVTRRVCAARVLL